jgi:meiosis-specific protein HOP1
VDQLVLAVYLNPAEPTNIIEAWLFEFGYTKDTDGVIHPTLQVRDRHDNLVADQASLAHSPDAVTRSAQDILKSYVHSTQHTEPKKLSC